MTQESENKLARRVDDKHPGTPVDWSDAPRFDARGIAESWSVTVEAEGQRIVCISNEHVASLDAGLDQFNYTIRSCAMHLLGFIGATQVAATAAPAVSPAPAAAGIEGLESLNASRTHLGAMERRPRGNYLRRTDVERLLGAHAGVVTVEPAAWMHEDGRVVTAATMNGARKDGGAMLSSLSGYTIPLYAAPAAQAPVQNAEEGRRAALEEAAKVCETMYRDGEGGAGCAVAADRIRALASKEAAAAEEKSQWISVEERLPEKYCLAAYVNSAGRDRIIRAMHVKQYEIEATGDDCYSEYREEDDTEYLKPGWYECIDNWGEYSSCFVNEGTVTHWMPLPSAPQQSTQGEKGGGE